MLRGMSEHASPSVDDVLWPWHTSRLTLRPAALADVDPFCAFRGDGQVQWFTGRGGMTREDVAARLDLHLARAHDPEEPMVSLAVLRDGAVVGDAMLSARRCPSVAGPVAAFEAEVGYTLRRDLHGQGLGTELVDALCRIAFGPLRLRRLVAHVFADHVGSRVVLERNGFRVEAHTVANVWGKDGRWWDDLHLALLRDEWQQRA